MRCYQEPKVDKIAERGMSQQFEVNIRQTIKARCDVVYTKAYARTRARRAATLQLPCVLHSWRTLPHVPSRLQRQLQPSTTHSDPYASQRYLPSTYGLCLTDDIQLWNSLRIRSASQPRCLPVSPRSNASSKTLPSVVRL